MFYLFLIFHTLLLIESYHLWKKRQRRKCLILTVSNIIVFILNMIKFVPTLKENFIYSDMIFLKLELSNHAISSMLWMILNFSLYTLVYYILKIVSQKKKQNRLLKNIITGYAYILSLILIIALFNNIASWIILINLILGFIWIIKEYIKTKKNYLLATMLILLTVGIYSFTTYTGAARIQIALQGYIIEAYDMGLEELVYYQEKNSKRYAPIENIEVEEGQIGFVEVDNYLGIKIGTYVGY